LQAYNTRFYRAICPTVYAYTARRNDVGVRRQLQLRHSVNGFGLGVRLGTGGILFNFS